MDPTDHARSTPSAPAATGGSLDPRMVTALVGVGVFGALFAMGALAAAGGRAGFSVAIGAAIALANLYFLAKILGALVTGTADDAPSSGLPAGVWGILAVAKVLFLFGGVWMLMSAHLVDPIFLVVGWGALPIGIVLGSIFSDKRPRSRAKEAPPPEAGAPRSP